MIRINLLPFRVERKKENVRRQISIFFLSFLLAAVVMIYFNINLNSKILNLNAKIKNTKNESLQYDKINKEIKIIKKKLEAIKKKTNVIKNLDLSRKEAVLLLNAMTETVIEQKMWLTMLNTKEKTVSINGVALDNTTVADFMTRLEHSKLFSKVELKNTKKYQTKKNIKLKNFEIICETTPLENAAKNETKNK